MIAGEPPLPTVPAAYTVRRTTPDDLDRVYNLVIADRTHHTGGCRVTRGMTEHLMAPGVPGFSAVVERDGEVVQWWNAEHEVGTPSSYAAVTSSPDLAEVEDLTTTGWRAIRAWVGSVLADPSEGVLRTGRPIQDEAGAARLVRNGFTATHVYWMMGGDVPSSSLPERHPPPPGLVLDAAADARQVHDVMQEGFSEHHAFSPQTFESAMTQYTDRPGFNPDGWYLARIDGRTAGAMVLSWEATSREALLVLELATLPWARGRGVATALLRKAFEVARQDGLARMELFVDSENTTGAPSLYRTVGLDVLQATPQFEGPAVWPGPQP